LIGAPVRIDGAYKHFGAYCAVRDVSIDILAGEFLSILGPSGSGKTTLLTLIAGFDMPSAGRIVIGGRDVTALAPNERDIGMVFQRYALFPHMTIADNIAFPLKMRDVGTAERKERVAAALDLVQLGAFSARYPHQLSGGQQQRVAVARAIVFEPPVLLMDEPLGALDKKLRESMQFEIKQLQQRLGATVIYVTHDQEEALTMSDRVAVMAGGQLVQLGSPADLYSRPQTAFVADFVGRMSFAKAVYVGRAQGMHALRLSETVVVEATGLDPAIRPGAAVTLAMRPEHLSLAPRAAGGNNTIPGTLEATVFAGAFDLHLVRADAADRPLIQVQTPVGSTAGTLRPGTAVDIVTIRDALHVFADEVV
jgi:mannopine transport system ATP-binding protein